MDAGPVLIGVLVGGRRAQRLFGEATRVVGCWGSSGMMSGFPTSIITT